MVSFRRISSSEDSLQLFHGVWRPGLTKTKFPDTKVRKKGSDFKTFVNSFFFVEKTVKDCQTSYERSVGTQLGTSKIRFPYCKIFKENNHIRLVQLTQDILKIFHFYMDVLSVNSISLHKVIYDDNLLQSLVGIACNETVRNSCTYVEGPKPTLVTFSRRPSHVPINTLYKSFYLDQL